MCAAYKLFRVLSFACLIGATSTTFANDRYIGSWASSVDNPDGTGPLRYQVSLTESNGVIEGGWRVENISTANGSVGCFRGVATGTRIVVDQCIIDGSEASKSGEALCPDYEHQLTRLVIQGSQGASLIWQTRPTLADRWQTFRGLRRRALDGGPNPVSCN